MHAVTPSRPRARRASSIATVLALAAFALLLVVRPAHAATWTPISSGTTANITGIDYQSPTRFWFVTGAGTIYTRQPDGSFQQKYSLPGHALRSIDFQATGNIGIATADDGSLYRSIDGGASWTALAPVLGSDNTCTTTATQAPAARSVRWAGDSDVYVFAGTQQVLHSTTGANGTWTDLNHKSAGGCKATFNDGPTDGYFVPGSPHLGWVVDQNFGGVFFSTDWTSESSAQKKVASAGNDFAIDRRLAVDAVNTNDQWAIARNTSGNGSNVQRTTDGWATAQDWHFHNNDRARSGSTDIAEANGTVVAVGLAGQVENSSNGADFFDVPAGGSLATQDWNAVDMFDANDAAIGGVGGALALSTDASVTPDITPPTATGISGPAAPRVGVPATYTLGANDTGGSGLDTAHYTWTVAGLPAITGPTATFTFTTTGFQAVRVSFKDLAGNAGPDQTLFVTVGAAPAPAAAPHVTFTGASGSGSALPATAGIVTIHGARFAVVKVAGKLRTPPGVSRAAACRGRVTLVLTSGGRKLATVRVAVSTRTCRFTLTARVPVARISHGQLKAVLSIPKTAALAAFSSSRTIRVHGA